MKKPNAYQTIFFILLMFFTSTLFAWDHSIDFGYGFSHDPNHTKYNNSGFLLSGDFYPIHRSCWTFWSLNAALGQWHTSAPIYRNLTTVALDVALRLYLFDITNNFPTYLLGSVGPVYLSTRQFGMNKQGSNFAFQVIAGLGAEFDHFDINLRATHYSNAYLARPDHGFTILYLLSVGYLF